MWTKVCVIMSVLTLFSPVSRGIAATAASDGLATATFAGGCFWSMQALFDTLDGVTSTTVGYTGGRTVNPTYEEVSKGETGHAEAVQVVYDPKRISYKRLLEVFWHNIDPTTPNAQFCDYGPEYQTAVFFHDETQRRLVEQSKAALAESGQLKAPIVTEIVPESVFYPAEEYHQHYSKKNPMQYKMYRFGCGRDQRLSEIWGPSAALGH
jgi:peptide-methionine (S)-S-oxide reductase